MFLCLKEYLKPLKKTSFLSNVESQFTLALFLFFTAVKDGDSPKYDLDIFQSYAGHGKIVFHYIGTENCCEDITGWVREFDSH